MQLEARAHEEEVQTNEWWLEVRPAVLSVAHLCWRSCAMPDTLGTACVLQVLARQSVERTVCQPRCLAEASQLREGC